MSIPPWGQIGPSGGLPGQNPSKSTPDWLRLSGPCLAWKTSPSPCPGGYAPCWELRPLFLCQLRPAWTFPECLCSPNSRRHGRLAAGFSEAPSFGWLREGDECPLTAGGGRERTAHWPLSLSGPQDHTALERLKVHGWCWQPGLSLLVCRRWSCTQRQGGRYLTAIVWSSAGEASAEWNRQISGQVTFNILLYRREI